MKSALDSVGNILAICRFGLEKVRKDPLMHDEEVECNESKHHLRRAERTGVRTR